MAASSQSSQLFYLLDENYSEVVGGRRRMALSMMNISDIVHGIMNNNGTYSKEEERGEGGVHVCR